MSSFKAFEKRKKTLLIEYKNQFKANKFTDKRIGENDANLSLEDKMFKRFVAERQKRRDFKKNKYNLNDDDDDVYGNGSLAASSAKHNLTHLGQSIAQIEKFERGDISDDDEDDATDATRGKIDAGIVSNNFFGGFKDGDEKRSRKEWIEEMIAKSKLAKYERQKEKDQTQELTEQLDKEWRNIMPLIGSMNKKLRDEENAKSRAEESATKPDDFDMLVKKLQFDPKGNPTDKIKSPEEMRKEQLEEAKRQERELNERMNKEIEIETNDKKSNMKGIKKAPANHQSADDIEFDDLEYLQLQQIEKRRGEEEDKDEEKDKNQVNEEDEVEEDEEEEEVEEDEAEEDEEDEAEKDNDEIENDEIMSLKKNDSKNVKPTESNNAVTSSLNQLKSLLTDYSNLFMFNSSTNKTRINTDKLALLTKSIYDITFKYCTKKTKNEVSPLIGVFRDMLVEINADYLRCRMAERSFPDLETLFKFKLISNIFPTSDYRHQIVTPCLAIMTRYLAECSIPTFGDLFRGLFLTNLCYEFVSRSKRFVSECIQYLNGILYLSIDWKKSQIALPSFHSSTIYQSFKKTKLSLIISNKIEKLDDLSLVRMSLNESQELDDQLKVSLIGYNLDLIKAFVQLNESIISFREIFYLTNLLLQHLPTSNYPNEITERVKELQNLISDVGNREREYLKCMAKKPAVNKLYEPRIETKSKFDPRHHNAVISEKQLLRRKYKKEMRSATKEIRQDNVFLARVELKEKLEKDAKRAQKVKEIMSSLANQEGEYQKIKRQKV